LQNSGTCDWSTAYQVIFSSGDQMGGPGATPIAAAIAVGATGNVSVELVAPATSGSYTGYWAIANAAGQAFGFFSVVIEVP
ncbi:MAG: NBR1-Ig-like domain-containing protein, partial [Anaerolineales bacterium]